MAKESIGSALILGAILLSLSVLGSSYFVSQAIDRASESVRRLGLEVDDRAGGEPAAEGDRRAARAPARPERGKRYAVELGAAPVKGGEDAAITIVEWSDFQCPFCRRVGPTLARLEKEYGDRIRIVFKHLPLPMHTRAPAAHAAAEAAHRQGRFWEMHDRIFSDPSKLADAQLTAYARDIGLDVERFERDRVSAEVRSRIEADVAQAGELGVTGTPSFFINGRFLSGAQPYESFKRVIDEELREQS
jgi:protein-disulfide isomerase